MTADNQSYYIGVDVGTGSARAAIVDNNGEIISMAEKPIDHHELIHDYITQSTTQIWNSISYCCQKIIKESKVDINLIKGIGFDATCSLTVINEKNDKPVAVGPDFQDNDQNIILWMDHRATKQTDEINSTDFKLLNYVGGKMSVEMEMPKIKWLKENFPKDLDVKFTDCKFYDLADYLTHRATGSEARSNCSTVCKQGYVPIGVEDSKYGWNADFLNQMGLPELVEDDFRRLGGIHGKNGKWLSAGENVGYLTSESAKDLGLTTNVKVGSGVIDAYAGWIGTVAAKTREDDKISERSDLSNSIGRLAAVAGTSTCHLALTKEAVFVPGVWGPYRDAIFPDYWLAEGGQSCTGELLRYVLESHPAYQQLLDFSLTSNINKFEWLNNHLEELKIKRSEKSILSLGKHFFFYGDFHGNRSPIADPKMKGSIIGQNMDVTIDNLALNYLGAIEFIAQQTRHIIETMNKSGHSINSIYLSGGQCRNKLLTKIISNATGLSVIIPRYIDSAVVFGSALLGAKAASEDKDTSLWDIMSTLTSKSTIINADDENTWDRKLLNVKYDIYLDMAKKQIDYRNMVDKVIG